MNQTTALNRICLLFLLLLSGFYGYAQTYTIETVPNPKKNSSPDYVSNPDQILSADAVTQINAILRTLEDSTTAQVAVVCVNSIGEAVPKDFATALFKKWGLGYQQKNNGLLVLLVKDQHRIEMETGYGLEGILPDAVCKRIQVEKMVPQAKTGNFDGAVIDGSREIARLISEPEAKAEVYDSSKYHAGQPLEDSGVFVVFLLLVPCLFVFRGIAFLAKKRNPVADQIEKAVSQAKGRWAWGFALRMVFPLILGWIVIELRAPLSLQGWQILTIMYVYAGAVAWDGRRRRKNAFEKLFSASTEPERYSREKASGLNNWLNMVVFPIPFIWLKIRDNKVLDHLRNHPRQTSDGFVLTKTEKKGREAFLSDYQKVEQELETVDYDVWRNEDHYVMQIVGYEDMAVTKYEHCDRCNSKAMHFTGDRIVKEATKDQEGSGMKDYTCKACGHHRETAYSIAMIVAATPSSTNSSHTYSSSGSTSWSGSSGSSSSSSSSSWGGGSSGGGGAGSSW
ncbi:TPM domain-containing protein [Dyadobacter sp. CY261]|uniref:TPM domain-containing protein n=1 Tax=Dyadobacter sp. CY261 TaxID=2907203 RepID=UPI001F1BAE0C|nr:TPM domain-containing protein [Dyadobacter sp. CY261]MCF0075011.1 TPM domain-containing protein [Dyadobacter sp. CY261]